MAALAIFLAAVALLARLHQVAAQTENFSTRADPFLGTASATRPVVQKAVGETLQSRYRADTEERLDILRNDMRSTFAALPKTEFGAINAAASRYLLHRFFLRHRAWLVNGLAPTGSSWESMPSPIEVLHSKAPGSVRDLFERRLQKRGLTLDEVAVLAAMIENQVHEEAVRRLRRAWFVEMPANGTMPEAISISDAREVLDMYMASYVLDSEEVIGRGSIRRTPMAAILPTWNSTQSFVYDKLDRVANGSDRVGFSALESVVVEISENYGRYQSEDCDFIKSRLVEKESLTPGQVSLRDFYKLNVEDGFFQFGESVDYMRYMGAAGQEASAGEYVLIANYINSPSQQVGHSESYTITCLDECEDLLEKVEARVAAPQTTPAVLADLLASTASRSRPASPSLSRELVERLERIAELHGGQVPLHGRLFAQVLHHVYPRECPYPYPGGERHAVSVSEYNELKGGLHAGLASQAEMKRFAGQPVAAQALVSPMPWDWSEELVAPILRLRSPILPEYVTSGFHIAACMTVVAIVLPNLALAQGVKDLGVLHSLRSWLI